MIEVEKKCLATASFLDFLNEHAEKMGERVCEDIYFDFADLFVTASTSETQSVSTMEAMAARCLVLVKDDETLVDLIERDKNGFIFNNDDSFVEEVDHVFSLSNDEIEKVKKAAFKTISTGFSLDKFYERIVEVYDRAQRKKW